MSSESAPPSKLDWLWYGLGVVLTPLLLRPLGLSWPQTLAVGGFCIILFGAIFFWKYRLAFACFGITLLLGAGLLDVPHLVEFAGLDIILFLIAMMTVIGFLEEQHFFEYVIDRLLLVVGPHPKKLMVVMMIMAAVSAALVDEVTSILFMVSAMLNLISRAKVKPLPFILMLVLPTNIGSSATVVGNPVGVIIALRSGLTFGDFLRWATPISAVCLAVTIPILLKLFAKDIAGLKSTLTGRKGEQKLEQMVHEEARAAKRGVTVSGWLFGGTILGLLLHHPLERWLHLPPNTMLIGVALLGAGAALAISGDKARVLIEKRVDWWTLLFFLLLFSSVGTLKQSGVTAVVAQRLIELAGGDLPVLTTLFAWSSWVLTSIMDNVLAVATFVPIVSDVGDAGLKTFPLWWAMLFGGTLGGNATLIGSTANIVAAGVLERRDMGTITFGQWLKPGMLVAIVTMVLATVLLLAQLSIMPEAPAAAPVAVEGAPLH
jgi:Na+/H+ antiporter NhaD/arsenite permease-like protein